METFINHIQDSDRAFIFNKAYEVEVIQLILGDTEAYKRLKENSDHEILPTEWVNDRDRALAEFSLSMFTRTKKLMLSDLKYKDFFILWDNYTRSPDYYIQVTNYMLNSEDYTSGDRYQLKGEEKEANFRESNMQQNMQQLGLSFQKDPTIEGNYLHEVSEIGRRLHELLAELPF